MNFYSNNTLKDVDATINKVDIFVLKIKNCQKISFTFIDFKYIKENYKNLILEISENKSKTLDMELIRSRQFNNNTNYKFNIKVLECKKGVKPDYYILTSENKLDNNFPQNLINVYKGQMFLNNDYYNDFYMGGSRFLIEILNLEFNEIKLKNYISFSNNDKIIIKSQRLSNIIVFNYEFGRFVLMNEQKYIQVFKGTGSNDYFTFSYFNYETGNLISDVKLNLTLNFLKYLKH